MNKIKKILDKSLEVLVIAVVAFLVLDVLWQVFTRYGSKLTPWWQSLGWGAKLAQWIQGKGWEGRLGQCALWVGNLAEQGLQPSSWTEELATFLLIWVALLGAAVALGRGAHLGIDYFVSKLPDRSRIKIEFFVFTCMALFSLLVMVIGGASLVARTFYLQQISPALHLEMGYVYLAVPISGAFLVLYSLIGFFERLSCLRQGEAQ
jgi:TRAP-type C4-dicarboxylate transport system permease small subunit